MLRLMLRYSVMVYLLMTILIGGIVAVNPSVPNEIGAVVFSSFSSEGTYYNTIDHDTGITISSLIPLRASQDFRAIPIFDEGSETVAVVVASDNKTDDFVGAYNIHSSFMRLTWYEYLETILIIYTDNQTEQTILELFDVDTGTKRPFIAIDNFLAGDFHVSGDGQYLLLRERQVGDNRDVNESGQMWLIHLATGEMIDFGQAVYAYFSPDSQQIAIGYEGDIPSQVSVEIYHIEAREVRTLDLRASQEDTIYFLGAAVSTYVGGILWSPDSQSLMVQNRHMETLTHVRLDGNSSQVYETGHILPFAWSPNGRYMLGFGRYDDTTGGYIIDTQTQKIIIIDSDVPLQESLADLVWSPDNRYLAMMTLTAQLGQQLVVYGLDGQAVTRPYTWIPDERGFILGASLKWVE